MKRFKSKVLLVCITALMLGSVQVAMAAPVNDNCSNATAVGNVTDLAFDTTLATFDGPGHITISPNIWYIYTATCTGCATISLCGSSYDTVVAAYNTTSCYPTSGNLIEANDDFCQRHSQMTFPVVAGNQYLIEIGGYNFADIGAGKLTISCDSQMCQPSNDDCSDADWIGNVTNLPFCITCATFDGPGHCIDTANIWYHYTASQTRDVTVSLQGSHFDTLLAVYEGGSCYPSSTDRIDCNDDFFGYQSRVIFPATSGQDYLIEVGGYSASDVGNGVISIYYSDGPDPPTNNDECADAIPVGNVSNLAFDTTSATFDGPGHFMTSPNIWYCYTATCTGEVTISLCGSSFDTKLAVYRDCTCYPTSGKIVGINDDACGQQSRVTFEATAGEQFLIEVGGYASHTGQGVMTITCVGDEPDPCPPSNDNCNNAEGVNDTTKIDFDTSCATHDGPGLFIGSPNIWYKYTASQTTDVTISLCGSGYDTKLAIYKGTSCNPTSVYASNDDSCGWQSEVTFAATAGQSYLIEVGGFGAHTGKGTLSVIVEGGGGPPPEQSDLGDAPDSTNNHGMAMTAYWSTIQANFPTVFNDGTGLGPYGPIHKNPKAVAYLGNGVSHENEADTGPDDDANNNILPLTDTADKDWFDNGITTPLNMPHCCWTTFDYQVKVVTPGTNLWVNVWCDWNRDGDWDDDSSTYPGFNCGKGPVSEWAVQNQFLYNLPAGLHKITSPAFLPWHLVDGPEGMWMRITLSEKPWTGGSSPGTKGNGGSGPQSGYEVGETEDYRFMPIQTCSMCEDYNGDGVIDFDDLSDYTSDWLQHCAP